jgi:futalosine hydrolase
MIALLCSVQAEADLLLSTMTVTGALQLGAKSIIMGKLAGREISLCIGGMGKVNAAHAATLLLTHASAEALIVFGIGGAYPSSGANVGDLALAKEEVVGDEGVLTPDGFKDASYIGIPLLRTSTSLIYHTFPASETLLEQSLRTLSSWRSEAGSRLHIGTFITLSTCTGTSARAEELEARYHGLCENMEGAAAAQVAESHTVPWLELRGISNLVLDRDLKTWDIPRAAHVAQNAVIHLLEGWKQ